MRLQSKLRRQQTRPFAPLLTDYIPVFSHAKAAGTSPDRFHRIRIYFSSDPTWKSRSCL